MVSIIIKYHSGGNILNEGSQKWIKRSSIIVAIWGVLSLLFSNPAVGIIFILFAILIYFSKNFIAIYAVGIILWIIGIIEILDAAGFRAIPVSGAQGIELILVAIVNFVIGIVFIYRTWKLS